MNIRGINYNFLNGKEIVEIVNRSILNNIKTNFYYVNAYTYNLLVNNIEYKNIFKRGIIINDGIGVYLSLKLLTNKSNIKRTVTTDIWNQIFIYCSINQKRIIIYGGQKNRFAEICDFIKNKYPGITLVGYSDGYSEFKIDNLNADIIFVGLGSFKQECYIDSISENSKVTVKIAVGSAIDFWSGAKKRAPLWMQKIGLEWLYRLFQEPKRLWKRYLLGIPVFVFNIIILKIKLMFKKEST